MDKLILSVSVSGIRKIMETAYDYKTVARLQPYDVMTLRPIGHVTLCPYDVTGIPYVTGMTLLVLRNSILSESSIVILCCFG